MSDNGTAGKTGSPGENTCTGCHTSFALNSGLGSITIASPNLTNWEYVPGQVYQIDVTVAQAGQPLFGFGFEALRVTTNTNGGTLANLNAAETQLKVANINGTNRTNVVHKKNAGLTTNSHTFSFKWTAPATNIGDIKFYTAGNASDNQADSLNDYIYTTTQLVTPLITGIQSAKAKEIISVFPNPIQNAFTFNLPISAAKCELQIFNIAGSLIFNETKIDVVAFNPIHVELPLDINNGIYFIKVVTDNNKTFVSKLVVVKQ